MSRDEGSASGKRTPDAADEQVDLETRLDSGEGVEVDRPGDGNDESLDFSDESMRSEKMVISESRAAEIGLDVGSTENSLINPIGDDEQPNEGLPGSVSILISKVKEGDEDSVRELWNRYSGALVRSAQTRISKQVAAKVDSEDLAQSVFFAIYRGAVEDKFEQLNDRAGFWTLVLAITRRKAVDRIRNLTAAKRGGAAAMRASQEAVGESVANIVDRAPSREVDPQVEVECEDLLESLKQQLDIEDASGMLTRVAMSRIAGLSVKEIAAELDRTERTVERKLSLIRSLWSESIEGL
ncbi:MAG: ECF-type sigma factor [Rubripirellula sp.]